MKKVVILLLINFLFSDYSGGYAGSGFRYSSNAREFALAGALVADRTPGFFTFSNPALIQLLKHNYFGLSIQNLSLDRSINSFNYTRKLPPNAGLGIGILKSSTNKIIGRNAENEIGETFSYHETMGIISFGVGFGSKFALGINIKTQFSSSSIIENYKGNGVSSDIGIIYKHNRKLYIGALINNISANYNWKVVINGDERSYVEKLPKNVLLGCAYYGIKKITLFFQEDIIITPNDNVNYRTRLGIEYKLKNKLLIRSGFKQAVGTLSEKSSDKLYFTPVFGLGIPINIWERKYIQTDYSLDMGINGEGLSHLFSFSLKL